MTQTMEISLILRVIYNTTLICKDGMTLFKRLEKERDLLVVCRWQSLPDCKAFQHFHDTVLTPQNVPVWSLHPEGQHGYFSSALLPPSALKRLQMNS